MGVSFTLSVFSILLPAGLVVFGWLHYRRKQQPAKPQLSEPRLWIDHTQQVLLLLSLLALISILLGIGYLFGFSF